MQKLKFLKVQFDTQIQAYEIPAFRGAVIGKVGRADTLLFHNHLDDKKYHYKYPLVQYKSIYKRPTLLCLGEGVEAIHKFFEQQNWDLQIGDKQHQMQIYKLDMNQFTMQIWDQDFEYQIRNWLPITQKDYQDYSNLDSITDKVAYLEKRLVHHILAFANGIDWKIPKRFEVKITDYQEPHSIKLKGIRMMAFHLKFKTSVFLPNYIGLGKGASIGFGAVEQVREKRRVN